MKICLWILRTYIFLILLNLPVLFLHAQNKADTFPRKCLTEKMAGINRDRFPAFPLPDTRSAEDISNLDYYVVPVVFHVIHQWGPENIPDSKIHEQIEVLNEDFGHYGKFNLDYRGYDTRIRFCLAKKDPYGNPTTGIIRIADPATDLDIDNEMATKDLSRWDPRRYLNIWVVHSIDGDVTIQGYSYLPRQSGGPEYPADGLVISYRYIGKYTGYSVRYDLGRTVTHEVGHYFDLMHTWGSDDDGSCRDDDGIDDTPVCSLEYYSSKKLGCNHPVQCTYVRLIEDFMDYSDDSCMKLFTKGQALYMRDVIKKYRSTLVSYQNLIETGCAAYYDSLSASLEIEFYPIPGGTFLRFGTHSKDPQILEFRIFDISGHPVYSKSYINVTRGVIEEYIPELRVGVYLLSGTYAGKAFNRKIMVLQKPSE